MNCAGQSRWREALKRFGRSKLSVISAIFFLFLIFCVIFLPSILGLDPYTSFSMGGFNQRPSALHWLGTDRTGRDLFARLVYGGRVSLLVGIVSTLFSMVIGIPLGLIAGYFRGVPEAVIMRVVDIFMSFPAMILVLVLVSVIGPSIGSIIFVLGILGWTQFTRLMHGKVLSVREMEYVEAARALGASDREIMIRYVLPNSFVPCLIAVTFRTAAAIMMEATLSFLGMGVQPPVASWGNLMYEAQSITVLSRQPWVWVPPGLCLIFTALSINFIGDGLRNAFDPKAR